MYKILFLFLFVFSFSFLHASNTMDGDENQNSPNPKRAQNSSVPEKTEPVIDPHLYNFLGGSTESSAKRKREDEGSQDKESKPKRTKVREDADIEEISTADLKKTRQENEMQLLILPNEVLIEILYFSDLKTFWALREVCKRVHGISGEPKLFIPQEPKLVIRWIQGFINEETLEVDQERFFQDLFYRNRHTADGQNLLRKACFSERFDVLHKDKIFAYDVTKNKVDFTPEFKMFYEEYLKLRASENKSLEAYDKQKAAEGELRRRLALFLPYQIACFLDLHCFEAEFFAIENSILGRLNAHPFSALPPFLIASYLTDPNKDQDELLFTMDRRLGLLSHEVSAQKMENILGANEPALYLHQMLRAMGKIVQNDSVSLSRQRPEDLEKFEQTLLFNYKRFINIAEAQMKILNREFCDSAGYYKATVKSLIAQRLEMIERIFDFFILDTRLLIKYSKESLIDNGEANGNEEINPEKEFNHHQKVGEYERRLGEMYLRWADLSKSSPLKKEIYKSYYAHACNHFTNALKSLTSSVSLTNPSLQEEQERLPLQETVLSFLKSLVLGDVSIRDTIYNSAIDALESLFDTSYWTERHNRDARTSTSIREMAFSMLDLRKGKITVPDLKITYQLLLDETDDLDADEEKIKALWRMFFEKYVTQFPVSKENAQDFLQLLSRTMTDDMCDEGLIVSENFPRMQIVEECHKAVFPLKLNEVFKDDLSVEDWLNLANICLTYAQFLEKEEKKDHVKIASLREAYVTFLEHAYEMKKDFCGSYSFENFLMAFVQSAQSYLKVGNLDKASAFFSKAVEYSTREAYNRLCDLDEQVKDYLQTVDALKDFQTPQAIAKLDQQVLAAFVTLVGKTPSSYNRAINICEIAEALMHYKKDFASAEKWREKRLRRDELNDDECAADLLELKTIIKSFVRESGRKG
ncbi:hypothetical protein [Candidatus Nucleicultrix amoebiphila]|jgi:hypothetical protein|uniref:F-box domain-containing protein n=1 Tax=Candidatus Nucleicultrix amoebiphila FS5 TaxID=1414854 RepID=A0A1W6N5J3_9PROT|nr:hypothetical protein [Candidatus Nucleicultrix amoebiphila]ARN85081.1 hypothetical protein GQ61_07015 [Candidatus Nucleicultrix amoebiphila FS5]